MRPAKGGPSMTQWPKPGRAVLGLMIASVGAYVLELILLRMGLGRWVSDFELTVRGVISEGKVWELFTYWWLHDPQNVSHLLGNMFWLWMFGSPLEKWWGSRRFLTAYFIFGLGGSVLTVVVGLLSQLAIFSGILGGFLDKVHIGASGAVMGCTVAWGIIFWKQSFQLFVGEITGKTMVLIAISIELLTALSFADVSSTSHFGGMTAAFILCRSLWRPSRIIQACKNLNRRIFRRKVEMDLRIIQGGDPKKPKQKIDWN